MKKITLAAIALSTSMAVCSANAAWFSGSPKIDTKMDKVSYIIGYDMGEGFKAHNIEINSALVEQGIKDAVAGKKAALSQEEMQNIMNTFQKEMIEKAQARQKEQAEANATAGIAYLDNISKDPGVIKIETGLYYKVIKAGDGAIPKADDTVTVNYTGTLTDGKEFDSSYTRGKPATFKLNQVIPGWTKALSEMPVGSTWEVYIAPELAYGKSAPPSIGPNSTLIFKIDLISIGDEAAKAAVSDDRATTPAGETAAAGEASGTDGDDAAKAVSGDEAADEAPSTDKA